MKGLDSIAQPKPDSQESTAHNRTTPTGDSPGQDRQGQSDTTGQPMSGQPMTGMDDRFRIGPYVSKILITWEKRWLTGSAPDCSEAVPGSNPAPPQPIDMSFCQ
jgi:hypothetical protein